MQRRCAAGKTAAQTALLPPSPQLQESTVGLHPMVNGPSVTHGAGRQKPQTNNQKVSHGKEKQRRQNDSGKKTRGEGARWQRAGQESSRRAEDHEHLSARRRKVRIRRPFHDGLFLCLVGLQLRGSIRLGECVGNLR